MHSQFGAELFELIVSLKKIQTKMKKSFKTKVEVTANVTYENDGRLEVSPVFKHEIFEHDASYRARVKVNQHGNAVVIPVREGKLGKRYDVLLQTKHGCVKASSDKVIVQLAFPKLLPNMTITELLRDDLDEIFDFFYCAHIDGVKIIRA